MTNVVVLKWKGPFLYQDALKEESGENRGIYLITGKRGDAEKVLRVGQAYDQTMRERLLDYRMTMQAYQRSCYVRFGIFVSTMTRIRVNDVESLLIYSYQPIWNQKDRDGYYSRDLQIINEGRRGPLDKVVNSKQ